MDSENDTDEKKINKAKLRDEIDTIQRFIDLAKKIPCDSKAKSLLNALEKAFSQLPAIGANRKALIFTESTRTQKYLKKFLEQNGYKGKIVIFNGSNSNKECDFYDWTGLFPVCVFSPEQPVTDTRNLQKIDFP